MTFGYAAGIPEGVTAAWGCRAILDGRTGHMDLVGDRQSTVAGPQHRLRNRRLRNDPPRHVRAALAALAALVPFVGATIGAIIGAFI